ncbi:MAG: hypothetical protein ACREF1_09565 [Acetobacteraceae bacterium]
MTARLVTTFGALALGLAAFAATPALAQATAPSGTAAAAAPPAAAAEGMVRPMHHGHMASTQMHHTGHHAEHHVAMKSHGHAESSDAAVNRLNDESLMAAQKGTNFTPGGMKQ